MCPGFSTANKLSSIHSPAYFLFLYFFSIFSAQFYSIALMLIDFSFSIKKNAYSLSDVNTPDLVY